MPAAVTQAYAFNRTRQAYLATRLGVARTHWSRLRGLMGTAAENFPAGQGLWIVPSHGVHTFAMRFPIDVIYLDRGNVVVHLEQNLRPWRVAPVRRRAVSVLELPDSTLRSTGTSLGDQIEFGLPAAGEAGAV
ncbi:MAG TPA: DUF192 domain-containing protein [Terriglobales bacterium]|nr:DUF192 domain-containing protein [Terriglobales bacterium]